jgi:hypothetical protein
MEENHLRKMAIEQFLQGKSPISIYGDLGGPKPWFYKWLHRYQSGQGGGFKDESKAPHHPMKEMLDNEHTPLQIGRMNVITFNASIRTR